MDKDFSMDFIYDLHKIVGIDAVDEFYNALESEADKERFLDALKKYYDTQYWKTIEGGCAV